MCAVRCYKISFKSREKKSSTILSKRVTPIKIKNKFEFRLRLCKLKIENGRAVIRLCLHKPLFRRGWFYAPLNQYNVGIESGGMKKEMKIFRGEENFPHRVPGGRESLKPGTWQICLKSCGTRQLSLHTFTPEKVPRAKNSFRLEECMS